MEEKKKIMHIMILYVIVIALLIWAFAAWSTDDFTGTDDWVCTQQICSASEPAGENWAQQNCGLVNDSAGVPIEACAVVIDGQQQIVPRSSINLSAIQQCTEFTCVQEVRVRNVNYTFEPPALQ